MNSNPPTKMRRTLHSLLKGQMPAVAKLEGISRQYLQFTLRGLRPMPENLRRHMINFLRKNNFPISGDPPQNSEIPNPKSEILLPDDPSYQVLLNQEDEVVAALAPEGSHNAVFTLLKSKGLSPRQLAKNTPYSHGHFERVINGQLSPLTPTEFEANGADHRIMFLISRALELPIDQVPWVSADQRADAAYYMVLDRKFRPAGISPKDAINLAAGIMKGDPEALARARSAGILANG